MPMQYPANVVGTATKLNAPKKNAKNTDAAEMNQEENVVLPHLFAGYAINVT